MRNEGREKEKKMWIELETLWWIQILFRVEKKKVGHDWLLLQLHFLLPYCCASLSSYLMKFNFPHLVESYLRKHYLHLHWIYGKHGLGLCSRIINFQVTLICVHDNHQIIMFVSQDVNQHGIIIEFDNKIRWLMSYFTFEWLLLIFLVDTDAGT